MKNIIYILFFCCVSVQGQTIVGQAMFTDSQLTELRLREKASTGLWISTNYASSGFYGDLNFVKDRAENFLTEQEGAGYVGQWTYFDSASPVNREGDAFPYEPTPLNASGATANQPNDEIHMAAFLAKLWDGETDSVTFSGETKTKDAHAEDLAMAVFEVLVEQSNDSKLDWSNGTKFPTSDGSETNPMFMAFSKMEKYLDSYSMVYDQIDGEAYFTSNYAGVESWMEDAVVLAKVMMENKFSVVFGGTEPSSFTYTNTTYDNLYSNPYTVYTSGGASGVHGVSWAQASGVNNRVWDFISYVSKYGLLFNDSTYSDWAYEMFKFTIKLGVFPDGTWCEWYRMESGSSKEKSGLTYNHLTLYHLISTSYSHAVAVENGLTGAGSDAGLYFDYTTSEGTDDMAWPSYAPTSTNGGPKGLKMMIKQYSKFFRTAANGGLSDVYFMDNGGTIPIVDHPFTVPFAMANVYYKDDDIKDFYMLDATAGYSVQPRYWGDGESPTLPTVGSWLQSSTGTAWGSSSRHAGYFAFGNMEDYVFTGSTPIVDGGGSVDLMMLFFD